MTVEPFVIPYARALLETATERGELDQVREEADFFLDAHFGAADPRLALFFESPRIEKREKLALVEKAFRGRTSETFFRFVRLVVDKGRASGLRDILSYFVTLHDRQLGRVNVEAASAVPLTDELSAQLRQTLESRLGKTVVLSNTVDPDLLGGLVVRFDGMVADGSLKTALEDLGARLLSQKLGSELVHEN